MKFNSFKEFRQTGISALVDLVAYMRTDLADLIRELNVGLNRLTLSENMISFQYEVKKLHAGDEIRILNELRVGKSKIIPTKYLIVRRKKYAEYIVDGDTQWDENYLYLKNVHPTADPTKDSESATFTVVFLA